MTVPSHLPPALRRSALETLGRDCLIDITHHFGIDVGDRRVIENHVSALVRSQTIDFGEVLDLLEREELQDFCDALGLDRGGGDRPSACRRYQAKHGAHELKRRSQTNLVQSRLFSEMLERALRAYRNRAVETAQVTDELIKLAFCARPSSPRRRTARNNDGLTDSGAAPAADSPNHHVARSSDRAASRAFSSFSRFIRRLMSSRLSAEMRSTNNVPSR